MKMSTHHLMQALVALAVLLILNFFILNYGVHRLDKTGLILLIVFDVVLAVRVIYHFRKHQDIGTDEEMTTGREQALKFVEPNARKWVWIVLVIGLAGAALETWSILRNGKFHYAALLAVPILILLGIGGLVDPRIMVGMRKDMPWITPGIRKASYALGFGGLAIGLFLIWWFGFRQP